MSSNCKGPRPSIFLQLGTCMYQPSEESTSSGRQMHFRASVMCPNRSDTHCRLSWSLSRMACGVYGMRMFLRRLEPITYLHGWRRYQRLMHPVAAHQRDASHALAELRGLPCALPLLMLRPGPGRQAEGGPGDVQQVRSNCRQRSSPGVRSRG